jgi:hypothetical protein
LGALGTVSASTPSSRRAVMAAASTPLGRRIERANLQAGE